MNDREQTPDTVSEKSLLGKSLFNYDNAKFEFVTACFSFVLDKCELSGLCGNYNFTLSDCNVSGEAHTCKKGVLRDCKIDAQEFLKNSRDITVVSSFCNGNAPFLNNVKLFMHKAELRGRNALNGSKDVTIENSKIDSVDGFSGCENVTVINSVIVCERVFWGAKNVTLRNCTVIGEEPFCNCKNVRLYDCIVKGRGAFNNSYVRATLRAPIDSIVNPRRGTIVVPSVGEIVRDEKSKAKIMLTGEGEK